MPPKETHEIKMMYAVYADGRKEPIVIDEIKDLSLEEAEPIIEEHNFVKVTRCKDCEHRFKNKWFCCDGRCLDDEQFCGFGEPKSESLRFYKKAKACADAFKKGLEDGIKETTVGDMWSIDPREIEEDYIFKWEDVREEDDKERSNFRVDKD